MEFLHFFHLFLNGFFPLPVRKGKPGKGQTEADTAAAAHKVAQQNAINETAAAFRGTHLDANARWDEVCSIDVA